MENFQDRGVRIRIRFALRGWIRIRFVLRGWIRIRSISDRIRNPGQQTEDNISLYMSYAIYKLELAEVLLILSIQ